MNAVGGILVPGNQLRDQIFRDIVVNRNERLIARNQCLCLFQVALSDFQIRRHSREFHQSVKLRVGIARIVQRLCRRLVQEQKVLGIVVIRDPAGTANLEVSLLKIVVVDRTPIVCHMAVTAIATFLWFSLVL